MKLAEIIPRQRLMPLIYPETVAQAVEDASSYREAGYLAVEILCRTPCALEAIARTSKQMPDLLVGAGTVLTLDLAEQTKKAGAKFLVSPGTDTVIMDYAIANGLQMMPGVYSPTEVAIALRYGCTIQKLFPAEPDGIGRLNAFASPYAHTGVQMVVGHQIVHKNAPAYLKHPLVAAIIADWLIPLRGAALRDELARTNAWFKGL